MTPCLKQIEASKVSSGAQRTVQAEALAVAKGIVTDIQRRGTAALQAWGQKLDGLQVGAPLYLERPVLERSLANLDPEQRALLERVAARIAAFAKVQRDSLRPVTVDTTASMIMGHEYAPIQRVGCYVPGGRYPLVSSVFMGAITARIAGVEQVVMSTPAPSPMLLAAAAIADVDGCWVLGGAQGIAALAYGNDTVAGCDMVVGPGNRYVTAAKFLVSVDVGIDALAGPSELLVCVDDSANAAWVAADLLAQAEHDSDARVFLLSRSQSMIDKVQVFLTQQLASLPTAKIAQCALRQSFAVRVSDLQQMATLCDRIAPEHLQLCMQTEAIECIRPLCKQWGALFIGNGGAEVFADYGCGPNHVLPTGGSARYRGGLSVASFLRLRTWMQSANAPAASIVADSVALAQIEGLIGHANAAQCRKVDT